MAREMKDSGIVWVGEIPNSWSIHPVYYYFSERKNKNIFEVESNLLSLSYGQIIRKNINSNEGLLPESFNTYNIVEEDDIIIRPTDLQNDKRSLRTGIVKERGIITSAYISIKAIKELNAAYFHYLLYIYDVTKVFYNMGNGVRQGLNFSEFSKLLVIEPPIEEQCKIVTYLDRKCNEINSLTKDIQTQIGILEDYKKSIITEAVTKGLNPDAEMKDSHSSYLGRIPKHWKEKRLRFLGVCQNGISKSSEFFGEGYPFISYGDVYRNYVLPLNGSGLIKSNMNDRRIYSVKYGDVFFTRTSETIEEIGFSSTCLKTVDDATFAGFLIRFRPYSQDELLPEFAQYYFRSEIHRKFFVKEMNLVTRASLSQELLKKLPVLLPPIEEQKSISKYLKQRCAEIDSAIVEKKEQLNVLEQYKKSLIYEYVTGKREVTENNG